MEAWRGGGGGGMGEGGEEKIRAPQYRLGHSLEKHGNNRQPS